MTVDLRYFAALGAYVVLFGAAIFVFARWQRKRRRERWPVETKLLRGPGDFLRRKVEELGEKLIWVIYVAATAPLLLGVGVILFLAKTAPYTRVYVALSIAVVVAGAALVVTVIWTYRRVREFANYRLGYFGERLVAEHLEPLIAKGSRVFHDVPCEEKGKRFNLDHVVVGPTGAAVIETKAVRKRRGLPGREEYKVFYDGKQLIWPWGENRNGLEQVARNADWFREWTKARTRLNVSVKAVLTFPGWFVVQQARGPVTVVDIKHVSEGVIGDGKRLLSDAQIALIAAQLDLVCRDVED